MSRLALCDNALTKSGVSGCSSVQVRNLVILVCCQLISATGSIVFVTLGGIIGATLASNRAWATLPISTTVVVTALTTIPASMLMKKLGRGNGFTLASLSALLAVCVTTWALVQSSFALFITGCALAGINLAFTQQYRFAAAENVEQRYIPRAISFVLLGSIGGALLGPELVIRGNHWIKDVPYAGTMASLAILYVLQALLFRFLGRSPVDLLPHDDLAGRKLAEIVRQPVYAVAVLGATAGYGLMVLVMTATPLSMHVNDGHSLDATARVISAHVIGMYLPSLVTGFLVERFGVIRIMFSGAFMMAFVSIIGMQGQSVMHYGWALVLLGVSWNFLYVGGTTMLTYGYAAAERFRAQAFNEFMVFGTSAAASLLAGTTMHYFGWNRLMWVPLPLLALVAFALLFVRRDTMLLRTRGATAG